MTCPLAPHAVPADVVPSEVVPSEVVPREVVPSEVVPAGVVPAGWRLRFETGEFDRRPALLTREVAALEALGPLQLRRDRARGIPRRTAGHWRSLARLIAPLDAARAALHHSDTGAPARTRPRSSCGAARPRAGPGGGGRPGTGRRSVAPSSQAFRAAQPLPTETTVRPFTIALGYLLGRFSDFQHLGNFNRLQLAS